MKTKADVKIPDFAIKAMYKRCEKERRYYRLCRRMLEWQLSCVKLACCAVFVGLVFVAVWQATHPFYM